MKTYRGTVHLSNLTLAFLFTALLLQFCSENVEVKHIDGDLFHNVYDAKNWTGSWEDTISMKIPKFLRSGTDSEFILGADHPNGIRAHIKVEDVWHNIINTLYGADGIDPDYGELLEGYVVEVAYYDFGADGKSEILLGIGNKLTSLSFAVIAFNENDESLEILGRYDYGQEYVRISGDTIEVPYGTQGLYNTFVYNPARRVFADAINGEKMMPEEDNVLREEEGDGENEGQYDEWESRTSQYSFKTNSNVDDFLNGGQSNSIFRSQVYEVRGKRMRTALMFDRDYRGVTTMSLIFVDGAYEYRIGSVKDEVLESWRSTGSALTLTFASGNDFSLVRTGEDSFTSGAWSFTRTEISGYYVKFNENF